MYNLIFYIGPFIAAFFYALGALVTKRAAEEGAGIIRILFFVNVLRFLALVPILLFFHEVLDWSYWPQAFLGSIACFLGTIFVVKAIRTGDISIQTPIMGAKIPLVAIFSLLIIGGPIPMSWWVAAFLTFVALFLLGSPQLMKSGVKVSYSSIAYALASCALFGLTDVITAEAAPLFGAWPFLGLMSFFMALQAFILVPFFHEGIEKIPKKAWKWLWWGSTFLVMEELAFLGVIIFFGRPTVVNILYSSRGLMSLALVWFCGDFLGNREKSHGGKVILLRLAGTILLCAAIITILSDSIDLP